jgi:di/tricarboxylate transporter
MPPDAWIVLLVLVVLFAALVRSVSTPSAVMLGGLVVLVVVGVLSPDRAFVGFSSPATITIAGLFVVARAIRDHLGLERLLDDLLEVDGRGLRPILLRLLPPVALLSGLVNNTPVVATAAPIVRGWAERRGVAASRLLIPLSFATILGGMLTTIGTSTNLVVSGALEAAGEEPLGFFAVTPVGAPMVVVGIAIIVLLAPRLLPDRGHGHGWLGDDLRGDPSGGQRDDPSDGQRDDPSGGDRRGRPPQPWAVPARAGRRRAGRAVAVTAPVASETPQGRQDRHRAVTLLTTLAMVVFAATGLVPVVTAVLLACAVLVTSGAIRFRRALEALDIDVLLIVAAAIGLGVAVHNSGLAAALGQGIASLASRQGVLVGLALVAVGTVVLTELITNVAAAALVVPIAIDVAERVGGNPRGFAVAVALSASASFLTPIGYQTNTIVYGLGGYRFGDFWRLGLPLAAAAVATTLFVVPLVWR